MSKQVAVNRSLDLIACGEIGQGKTGSFAVRIDEPRPHLRAWKTAKSRIGDLDASFRELSAAVGEFTIVAAPLLRGKPCELRKETVKQAS